ncbi:hypothetical protein Nepgr_021145 [Nepenthes gracilis]|uniref:Uncharacterized protein n=1 Tax=Nepenthes gracilis TaxID=150966 RepID=A0AAD3XWS5_NEPGR|nr:hypothetical protein Nepgr_021145 [Nepenthes gracilis]
MAATPFSNIIVSPPKSTHRGPLPLRTASIHEMKSISAPHGPLPLRTASIHEIKSTRALQIMAHCQERYDISQEHGFMVPWLECWGHAL